VGRRNFSKSTPLTFRKTWADLEISGAVGVVGPGERYLEIESNGTRSSKPANIPFNETNKRFGPLTRPACQRNQKFLQIAFRNGSEA